MNVKFWYAIGLMSGTSLDGVDLVYVKFFSDKDYHSEIIKAKTIKYSDFWKNKFQNAFDKNADKLDKLSIE